MLQEFYALMKQQQEVRNRRLEELIILVQTVPVTDNAVEEIAQLISNNREMVLRNHPGYDVDRKEQSLLSMLLIFERSYKDLGEQLDRFHAFSCTEDMNLPVGRVQLESISLAVKKELVAFSASAMALVDFSRRLQTARPTLGFNARRDEVFDNEEHKFVTGLRNVLSHQGLPDIDWQITYSTERQTDYIMSVEGLLYNSELSSEARAFVTRFEKGVHVRALADSYAGRVRQFYEWYKAELQLSVPEALADYRRIVATCMANASRAAYRMMLQIAGEKADPYKHLHGFLLPEQLEQALKLPKRSKEQVNYIIEAADRYGACDDELRRMVYRLFKVSE